MFIVTAKVPKRRYLLLFALGVLAVVLLLVLLRGGAAGKAAEDPLRADTDEARVAYLNSLGWEVAPESIETVRLTLPEEMAEPYRSYNDLQLRQGFDLTPYLGKTLERCTYAVTNHPTHPHGCQADLYLYEGTIVAGDVVCTGEGGFISTLEFPAQS